MSKKRKPMLALIIPIIFVIIIFFGSIADFLIKIAWFKEVGYISVFFTRITATLKLMIPIFIICYLAIYFYYKGIKKSIIKMKTVVEVDPKRNKLEKRIFIIANIIISLVISFSFSSTYWYRILQFTYSKAFNVKDPIFNMDISFFVFKLPLIESLYNAFISLIIFLVIVTVVIYFVMNVKDKIVETRDSSVVSLKDFRNGLTKFAGHQLAVAAALFLLLLSLGFMIKAWNLVYSSRGVVFGASYTDVKINLKFYYITSVASLLAAIVVFVSILKSKVKPIIASVLVIVILVVLEGIVGGITQRFYVDPNEKVLETEFIDYNIEYTKKGFNVDTIDQQAYGLNNDLDAAMITQNKATIDNIRINAVDPAKEFYNNVQSMKNYYLFNDIDIDRYTINGKYNQVFITPREIDLEMLKDKSDTWQNKYLTYTHGYGVVMSKVNSVTSDGKPDFVIKDMPVTNYTDLDLSNPRIYFGENTNDYAIVNTGLGELDYPSSTGEKKYDYNGDSGIELNLFNRLLFAINKGQTNFLLSSSITSDSKIFINRNIMDRVYEIAPFLTYDSDPYLVINNGKLYWMIDAYTTSDRYPFSEPKNGINYVRNSIKIIVDAVDGKTNFYIVDENDPIAACYASIFPKLFKTMEELPDGFKEHFKYPEDIFLTQCEVLERYHVTDSNVFYRGDDIWDISKNLKVIEGESSINKATNLIMKLPDEEKEEMVIVQYFNFHQKENMVAMLGGRMDGDNYGKLVLYRFPTDIQTINSPTLFKSKINQDTTVSKELSLWNKEGSEVQFGDTIIIPVQNNLLYVEPIYLRAQGENSIPEMKRVVVMYDDKLVLAENIKDALDQLFNYKDNTDQVIDDKDTDEDIRIDEDMNIDQSQLDKATETYNNALEAQKNGDWAKYGEYIDELGNILENLKVVE